MTDQKTALLTPTLRLFMATMVLANVAARMESTLLPLYIKELGASVEQVGLFFTLASIAPLALQILGGWLSDKLGRLRAIAIGSLGGVLGYVVLFVAPSWEWLLIAAAARAMAHAFVAPSYPAFIAEQSDPERLGRAYAITDTIFRVVGLIGPPLGGFIALRFGYRAMFLVAGSLYGAATLIRIGMARAARASGAASSGGKLTFESLRSDAIEIAGLMAGGGVVLWVFVVDGLDDVVFELSSKLTPLYLETLMNLNTAQIGLLTSIMFGSTMLLTPLGGLVSDRKGEHASIALGFVLYVVGQTIFILSRSIWGFVAVWAVMGAGVAFVRPAFNALVSKVLPNRLRGMAFGLFATSTGLVSLPAPYLGGLLWQWLDPRVPFVVPIVGLLLILPLVWFRLRVPAPREAEVVAADYGSMAEFDR